MARGVRKAVAGTVSDYGLRQSKSGGWAHTYTVGRIAYTHFSDDVIALMRVGDKVRFFAEKRTLRSGSRRPYFSIDAGSIEIASTPELAAEDSGYLYVLVHPAMQGLRKIGFTRSSPESRAEALSAATGVPGKFRVEWSMHVNGDPASVEKAAHALLDKHRFEKEFFRAGADAAREAIQNAYATLYPSAIGEIDAVLQERVLEQGRLREEALKRIEAARLESEWKSSDEYQWTRKGVLRVPVLAEIRHVDRPGLLQRMFSASFPENADILIRGLPNDVGVVSLNATARRRVVKMGDGSEAFCRQAADAAAENLGVMPRNFDLEEMRRDLASHDAVNARMVRITQLQEQMRNTEMALGSDAMVAALEAYSYLKNAGEGEGVEQLRRMLGRRFEDNGPKASAPPEPVLA